MSVTTADAEAIQELAKREFLIRKCEQRPSALMDQMVNFDEQRVAAGLPGEFEFNMRKPKIRWDWSTPELRDEPWTWQRQLVDEIHAHSTTIVLKARQLGATWLGCGYAVWLALYRPGSLSLVYRQKKEDSEELIARCKTQVESLPHWLRNGAKFRALKGSLEFTFPGGLTSRILSQSSADASGHGKTAAFILLDEFAYIENSPMIMKAVSSAAGQHGRIMIVSTANGLYDERSDTGNYFAGMWTKATEDKLHTAFLPWWFHSDRGPDWLETAEEVRRLRPWERTEQYPSTPEEAFRVTNACFFDMEALHWYAGNAIKQPLYLCHFDIRSTGRAKLLKTEHDWISVYEEPDSERTYAIGADVASGAGLDYSAAFVVDLSTMALCAEFHGKLDEDQYAEQLHYLGRWYGRASFCRQDAVLAIERGGGFGNATVISLTDGRKGRPPYSNLYRHREHVRVDHLVHKNIGYPMTSATRMPALEHLESVLREKDLPWLTRRLHSEMGTFVRFNPRTGEKPSGTWPRAMQGTNDDLVMAAAVTLEMYRERGHHPERRKRTPSKRKPLYSWSA